MADLGNIAENLIAGKIDDVAKQVQEAVDGGTGAQEVMEKGLLAGMDVVGQRFKSGEMFIPEVLRAAKAMHAGMEILRPLLAESDAKGAGTLVLGTVEGDLHDIGKNLVAMMMESAGMQVTNVGVDIPPEDFVSRIKETNAKIVCLSALLTTTMPMMKQTIDAIVEAGLRDQVKILVGGAPVTQSFADEIGADGFAPDAGSAAKLAKSLI